MLATSRILISYWILGPVAWLLFAWLLRLSYRRMKRFARPRLPLPDSPPRVTILIPAKDEGEGIRDCLERVLTQDYPNFSVLAVDDRSTDATGAIMDDLAAANPDKLRALHIPQDGLPLGWLGKCNALNTAEAHAEGEWLLFVDSDVKIEPDALSVAIARATNRGYDAVSIMTRLETETFWEKLVLPLAAASVGVMTLMSLTNDERFKNTAFANGQFFLIRRSVYESVGGHSAVRDNITEDVALMRIMKAAGHRCRLYYGRNFASTRMHADLPTMFRGWSRIYSGVTRRRVLPILAVALFVTVCGLFGYVALAYGAVRYARIGCWDWLLPSSLHVVLMTIVLAAIYRMSGNEKRYALAFPVGGAVMLAIYASAIRTCRTGRIAWRGTSYTAGSATSPAGSSTSAALPAGGAEAGRESP